MCPLTSDDPGEAVPAAGPLRFRDDVGPVLHQVALVLVLQVPPGVAGPVGRHGPRGSTPAVRPVVRRQVAGRIHSTLASLVKWTEPGMG